MIREIGRLHFLVSSHSQPDVEWLVDMEPEYEQGGLKYFCGCPRFNENTHHHHTPCHHLREAVEYVRLNYQGTKKRGKLESLPR